MIAGRELDHKIAEHVTCLGRRALEFPNSMFLRDRMGSDVKVPHYSTDIAAAWTVVEKMREVGWFFDINVMNSCTAAFRRDYLRGTERFNSKEEEAPLAICLAALKAMGVET